MRVSVIGGGDATSDHRERAEIVGQLIADRGHTLVCGGLGGVMEAACRGATERDGETIGILSDDEPRTANPYVDTPIATGIGHARNAMVVMNGNAVIAIGGSGGTLSEIGYSAVYDRPIASLGSHNVAGVTVVDSPTEAVDHVENAVTDQ